MPQDSMWWRILKIFETQQGLHMALFTSTQKPKIFQDSPSYRIFRHMHEVLNVDENNT